MPSMYDIPNYAEQIIRADQMGRQARLSDLQAQALQDKMAEEATTKRAMDIYSEYGTGPGITSGDMRQMYRDQGIPGSVSEPIVNKIDEPRKQRLSNMALAALSIDDPTEQKEAFKLIHSQLSPEEQQQYGTPDKWTRAGMVSFLGNEDVKQMMDQWKTIRTKKEALPYKVGELVKKYKNGKQYQYTYGGRDAQGQDIWGDEQPIPETKPPADEKPLTGDTAGKLAMLNQASRDVQEAEKMLFASGKLDTSMLAGGFFGLPTELGREINSRIENAVAAKLRAETGAAATEGEVKNVSKRFKPKPGLDDENAVRDKLRRLQEYLDEAAGYIDPKGTHRAAAAKNRQAKGSGNAQAQRKQGTDGRWYVNDGKGWRPE